VDRTHSRVLADEITARTSVRALTVVRQDGATSIKGLKLDGHFEED
jgi:hypothetical protein